MSSPRIGTRVLCLLLLPLLQGTFLLEAAAASRTPWTQNRVLGSPLPPAPYAVERVLPQAGFRDAVDLAFAPGTRHLFVSQVDGKIFAIDTAKSSAQAQLALDLRALKGRVDSILGFTFHPGFTTNGWIFLNYNRPGDLPDASHIARFTVSSLSPPTLDPASERIVLRWPGGGHNGCALAFGPDGMLYVSTGDGAAPDPPDGRFKTGQDLSDLLAAILRIDVDTPADGPPYRVPADNPFRTTTGARPEIWAFGFRNPFRISFGPDGSLWAADVGWEQWEMVYRIQRAGNYGWPITEGPNLRVRDDVPPGPGPILPPLHAIPHTEGASITGGQVYRGSRLPELRGAYIYGDWETGRFWALRNEGDRLLSNLELCDTALKPVSFTLDPEGDLLILDYQGGLYRLVPQAAPAANQAFPRRLSETGLAASMKPLRPAPGVIPYSIQAPMWNDHACAEWWLGIPGTDALGTSGGVGNIAGGTWHFPTNTVLARTLSLEFQTGAADSARPVETQLLHWDGQAWNPYSYQWNDAGTDAELVPPTGTQRLLVISDPRAPGGVRRTPWRFMSRSECLRCHNAWAGETLTLQPLQLGGFTPRDPKSQDASPPATSEFERLAHLGAIHPPQHALRPKPTLVNPYQSQADLADRARSWLHVNCSTCHRFGAGGAAALRLNVDSSLEDLRIRDVRPTRGELDLTDARIVAPGDPWRSTLLFRIATEGAGRMPHIGSRLTDETGVALVRDWIRSLPAPETPTPDPRNARIRELLRSPLSAEHATELLADARGALASVVEPDRDLRFAILGDAAVSHPLPLVRDLLQRFLPPERRRETLGAEIQPDAILALAGDAARGRALFEGAAQCVRCHARNGVGRAFGPELKGLSKKYTRAQLLDQILRPSATVAPDFRTVTVTLTDDSERVGFVIRELPDGLVLREESLAEIPIQNQDIRDRHTSALSAMPEGLLAPLTAQEAADLLESLLRD